MPSRNSAGSVRESTTAKSRTSPPSQQAIARTWIASAGMARPVSMPVPAWPASPGVSERPTQRTPAAANHHFRQRMLGRRMAGQQDAEHWIREHQEPESRQRDMPVPGFQDIAEDRGVEDLGEWKRRRVDALERDADNGRQPRRRSNRPRRATARVASRVRPGRPPTGTRCRRSATQASRTARRGRSRSTTPTVVLPPWFERRRFASASAPFTDPFAPTWNVNAPCTGCESAEMTRQVTT